MSYVRADVMDAIDTLELEVRDVLGKVIQLQLDIHCDEAIKGLIEIEDDLVEIVKSLR